RVAAFLHFHPDRAAVRRLHGTINELHPTQPVVYGREIVLLGFQWVSIDVAADRLYRAVVEIREGLEISLGMPPRNARAFHRACREVLTAAARERFARLAVAVNVEVIRVLLRPHHGGFRPVHAQDEAVLLAGGDLADREHAFPAALKTEERVDVLVQHTIGKKDALIGADLGHAVAGDILDQVERVGSDVAHRAADARLLG